MPEIYDRPAFEIEHIIARQHGGPSTAGNLAWACFTCNKRKGPNLSGIDDLTRKIVPLFHPRRQKWSRHFRWQGAMVLGRTPTGRATTSVLGMNLPLRIRLRLVLIEEGALTVDDLATGDE
jgi:HNH endonuclease